MSSTASLSASASVRSTVSPEGAILMDIESGLMFSLNDVRGCIWQHVQEGHSRNEIAQLVSQQYAITFDLALTDVDVFIAALERNHLVMSS
jgi:hypothetical protein